MEDAQSPCGAYSQLSSWRMHKAHVEHIHSYHHGWCTRPMWSIFTAIIMEDAQGPCEAYSQLSYIQSLVWIAAVIAHHYSPEKWLYNRIYCPSNRSKQIKETHTAYGAGTQYTRQSLNEKQHTWLYRQTVVGCEAMYVVFHSNFAAFIVCQCYEPCGFPGLVWTDCWGNKSYYIITSLANILLPLGIGLHENRKLSIKKLQPPETRFFSSNFWSALKIFDLLWQNDCIGYTETSLDHILLFCYMHLPLNIVLKVLVYVVVVVVAASAPYCCDIYALLSLRPCSSCNRVVR